MSGHNHMPPVPSDSRSHKGTGDNSEVNKDAAKVEGEVNTTEQGDTANIKQNTTNKGATRDGASRYRYRVVIGLECAFEAVFPHFGDARIFLIANF